MECKASDSKKLCKVFDAPKRSRRKKNGLEESSESDASKSITVGQKNSKPQLAADPPVRLALGKKNSSAGSSSGASPARAAHCVPPRTPHSPRRRKGGNSLALKPSCGSPRSDSQENSPRSVQRPGVSAEVAAGEKDGYIYEILEEALKKKKHKSHAHRHDGKSLEESVSHRHRRHSRRDTSTNRAELLETFVKICAQSQRDSAEPKTNPTDVIRKKSNKSLQCECVNEYSDIDRHPTRLRKGESPRDLRRHQNYSRDKLGDSRPSVNEQRGSRREPNKLDTGRYTDPPRHSQEIDLPATTSRDYLEPRIYDEKPSKERLYEKELRSRFYDERSSKERYFERHGDERIWAREDRQYRDRNYEDRRRRCEDRERYDRDYNQGYSPRRNPESKNYGRHRDIGIREDRRRFEERESDISVIGGADSIIGGNAESERFESPPNQLRNDCLSQKNRSKACKESVLIDPGIQREVAEQREALDRMMKLWQELMARFKDVAENMGRSERTVQETAAAARESAATQLQLWRECMQRYDTVARDVGDTDARLMEELQRQKAEMAEMSSAWQECLVHYKEMSSHLTTIKQKISTECPPPPAPQYAPAPHYPPAPPADGYMLPPPHPAYPMMYGSPVRARTVAGAGAAPPPPWWWGGGGGGGGATRSPPPRGRRTPSLESRGEGSRERRARRHRDGGERDKHHSKEVGDSKLHVSRSDRRRKK